jgi:hypothetical protein
MVYCELEKQCLRVVNILNLQIILFKIMDLSACQAQFNLSLQPGGHHSAILQDTRQLEPECTMARGGGK